ncbi:MAG: Holliday junction branch migration protein RuvA [Patescibacteria group bacterium]|jgi:Holliday junction DNA helicase RuvA
MIGYLKGVVKNFHPGFIILDVSGVGYNVRVSPQVTFLEDMKECELFIHHHIKEDISDLYGFLTYQELELFEKLLSVNGVGPKAAMTIIGMAPADKIFDAIISEDSNFFQSAPGIGKKVAIKIILDLKSKISNLKYSGNIGEGKNQDVYDGLETLGYKKQEIDKIIGKLPKDLDSSEDKIRWCLKHLINVK